MSWQDDLRRNLTTTQDLQPYIKLNDDEYRQMDALLERFPMSVTPYYLSLIDWDDPADPIRRMAIPSIYETDLSGSFDTSGEASNTVVPGMQHKYRETVMILTTNACAMYCRHCFRKRLVGLADDEVAKNYEAMGAYISAHTEISNALISGGDVLLNSNERLRTLLAMLCGIEHLDFIRFGTRVPVVFPQRITEDVELLELLDEFSAQKQLVLVTQFNHPREITPQAAEAIKAVRRAGMPVRNQAVLLRGVNDDAAVLSQLLRQLTAIGVQPYYVFQCRPVSGVKNQFQVPLRRGCQLVEEAKQRQNGLGKMFRYCMSHVTGKLEILGAENESEMLFKYQECTRKQDFGRLYRFPVAENDAWLPENLGI